MLPSFLIAVSLGAFLNPNCTVGPNDGVRTLCVCVCVCVCERERERQCNPCTRFGAVLSAVYRLYAFSYGFVAEIFNSRNVRTHTHTYMCTSFRAQKADILYWTEMFESLPAAAASSFTRSTCFDIYQLPYHSTSSSTARHHGLLYRDVTRSDRYVRMFRRNLYFQGS